MIDFGYYTQEEALQALGIASADDPKLVALAGLSWGGNALKVLQVNATENGWQFAAVAVYTDENAQDAIGGILADSATIDFTYDDGAPSITASVKDDSITFAKVQNIATGKVLGRTTAASGDVEELATTGTGTVVFSISPALTGTATFEAATFSGNVTLGDTTGDGHTVNGGLTLKGDASSRALIFDLGATIRLVDLSTGGATYFDLATGGAGHGSMIWRSSSGFAQILELTATTLNMGSGMALRANGVQVVTSRQTGWGAPTGTPTRTTFATGSVTLPQLAERVKALIDDLTAHGLIGA